MSLLCQVALGVLDIDHSHRFYRDVLGFIPAGGWEVFEAGCVEDPGTARGFINGAVDGWAARFMQLELRVLQPNREADTRGAAPAGYRLLDN